jgi:hypothetical protein
MWTDPAWRAERLAQAFADGQTVEVQARTVSLRHHHAGDLIVTSGQIAACDPGWLDEDLAPPFVTLIEPGQYPVVLTIADFPDGDERVAYATLRVQDGVPIRSEIAVRVGDDAHTVTPEGEPYVRNYGVDSGTGCFMDANTRSLLVQKGSFDAWLDAYDAYIDDVLLESLEKSNTDMCGWADLAIDTDTGGNLVAFSSGWGDGGYVTYIGYDAEGTVTCFTTDFMLLGEEG